MKKNLLSLFLILTTYISFAQTNTDTSRHLVFKGVPLDGTLAQYVSKMKQSGFDHLDTENGVAILQGDFAGYKDCSVGVSTLTQKDLVHKIVVLFTKKDTWSTLSENYFNLKDMLTEKYGKPSDIVENLTDHLSLEMMTQKCMKLNSTAASIIQPGRQIKEIFYYLLIIRV